MDFGPELQVQSRACSTLTVFTDSERESVSSWVIMLDGFLLSASARTQSVFAATAATSEAKVHPSSVLGLWTTREDPSAFRQLWRHWFGKQKRSATVTSSGLAISVVAGETASKNVPGPENVADANTKPADRRSLEFCRLNIGVTEIPKQFRDTVL